MSWFSAILPGIKKKKRSSAHVMPDGVWDKCKSCGVAIYGEEFQKNLWVCANCDYHHRITATQRAAVLFDPEPAAEEMFGEVRPTDFLKFTDDKSYGERLKEAQKENARREAVISFCGHIKGIQVAAAIFDFTFMGGSMGSVAGERFVRIVDEARGRGLPFVSFAASGGARMQEGVMALVQMAKTNGALSKLAQLRLPHISVLTDPTTGGVAASFAMIGDIIIAEPKALIGFAGPRVIQETVREQLPEGFQRSEFLRERGTVDLIVDRGKCAINWRFFCLCWLPPPTKTSCRPDWRRGWRFWNAGIRLK